MLDDDRIMPHETQTLQLKVDNMFFFKDNEYDGNVQKGYSLPGVWIRPRLTYQPTRRLRLEVGLHALAYHGANKYPNYAYQDIGTWKGSQYQRGAHVLPFLRAQLKLKHADLVFGDIYGQSNHRLVTPLYDPELDLTSDPEAVSRPSCAGPTHALTRGLTGRATSLRPTPTRRCSRWACQTSSTTTRPTRACTFTRPSSCWGSTAAASRTPLPAIPCRRWSTGPWDWA